MLGNIDEDTYYSKQCHEINEQSFLFIFWFKRDQEFS